MKYKYTLNKNFTVYLPELKHIAYAIYKDKSGKLWGYIRHGTLTIFAEYAWNGCSPKFKLLGKEIGTPDGKNDECKFPSLVHDFIYQFKIGTRAVADSIFQRLCNEYKWQYASLYYTGVRLGGWLSWYLL